MLGETGILAASPLAYVECRAAFARLGRAGDLSAADVRRAALELDARWSALIVVELDDAVRTGAGALAGSRQLRGADAVHLASARSLAERSRQPMRFACFDRRLWGAAQALGFATVPATEP